MEHSVGRRQECRWVWVLAALALAGCTTIYNPATEQRETVLTTSVEMALGNLARAQMGLGSLTVGEVKPEMLTRVQRIGKRLAAVSDRKDLPYHFGVVKAKSLNAFALPGGTIYVHTTLAEKATDEELAAVLAHEIGHVAARHAAKHLQWNLGITTLLSIASSAGASADSARMVNSIYGLISNGYGRRDELEADRLAIRYMNRAHYNPKAIISFFEKMDAEDPETTLDKALIWQRSHPLTSDRIEQVRREIKRLAGETFCPACGRTYGPEVKFCERDGTVLKKKQLPEEEVS